MLSLPQDYPGLVDIFALVLYLRFQWQHPHRGHKVTKSRLEYWPQMWSKSKVYACLRYKKAKHLMKLLSMISAAFHFFSRDSHWFTLRAPNGDWRLFDVRVSLALLELRDSRSRWPRAERALNAAFEKREDRNTFDGTLDNFDREETHSRVLPATIFV